MVKKETVKAGVRVRLLSLYNSQSLILSYSIHLNAVCVRHYGIVFTVGPYIGMVAEMVSEVR